MADHRSTTLQQDPQARQISMEKATDTVQHSSSVAISYQGGVSCHRLGSPRMARPDIPGEVLAGSLKDAKAAGYDVSWREFYAERAARDIVSQVKRGPTPKYTQYGGSMQSLSKAADRGDIAQSTLNKMKRLSGARKTKHGGDAVQQKRTKLSLLHNVTLDNLNELLVALFVTYCIARECLRLKVDPMVEKLKWLSPRFPVELFYRLLRTKNIAVPRAPSMHQAMFGSTDSLHWHNLQLVHDDWFKKLSNLVIVWVSWAVPAKVQVQLISLANAFNGKAVLDELSKATASHELPVQAGDTLPRMWSRCESFLARVLTSGRNVYSIRFRLKAYNSCQDPVAPKSLKAAARDLKLVLTAVEAESLAEYSTYVPKLDMMARTRGYNINSEESFLGKNLLNVLFVSLRRTALLRRWRPPRFPRPAHLVFFRGVVGPARAGGARGERGGRRPRPTQTRFLTFWALWKLEGW